MFTLVSATADCSALRPPAGLNEEVHSLWLTLPEYFHSSTEVVWICLRGSVLRINLSLNHRRNSTGNSSTNQIMFIHLLSAVPEVQVSGAVVRPPRPLQCVLCLHWGLLPAGDRTLKPGRVWASSFHLSLILLMQVNSSQLHSSGLYPELVVSFTFTLSSLLLPKQSIIASTCSLLRRPSLTEEQEQRHL